MRGCQSRCTHTLTSQDQRLEAGLQPDLETESDTAEQEEGLLAGPVASRSIRVVGW